MYIGAVLNYKQQIARDPQFNIWYSSHKVRNLNKVNQVGNMERKFGKT